ncbi:MAG: hypothetical protein QXL47_02940 [Candidatus Anstonellales archaeon]
MIVGNRVSSIEAKRGEKEIKGLDIRIGFKDVRESKNEDMIEIDYEYIAAYREDAGEIKIGGTIFAKENEKTKKAILDAWKKDKKLPDEYMEVALNNINFMGAANGTIIAKVLNTAPPLIPPRLRMQKKSE